MSATPVNLGNSTGNAAGAQANKPKAAGDVAGAKDVTQKKADSDNTTTSIDDKPPQMFEQVLSDAKTAQKPDAGTPAVKSKTAATDDTDTAAAGTPALPDIALLMSLLPALPPGGQAQAEAAGSALAPPDVAVAAVAVSPSTPLRTVSAAPADPASPPILPGDAEKISPTAVTADVATGSSLPLAPENRLVDKTDLFAALIGKLDSAANTATPVLAMPTHQAPTLTAVAQALPLTAPGSLDELPISHRGWSAALGHSMLWAVGEGIQKVELSVSPPDMGPINVHIRVENDKADIRFTAAHAMTRDALEASIPRLRDMFSQQGLNLSQAQVFSQNSHDTHGRQPDANPSSSKPQNGDAAETQDAGPARPIAWRRGLVDDYA